MKLKKINWGRYVGSNVLTVLIFLIFFAVGPVSALNVFLSSQNDVAEESSVFGFEIGFDINSDSRMQDGFVIASVFSSGDFFSECIFDLDGNLISCDDNYLYIEVIDAPSSCSNYDYSYGYWCDDLSYGYGYDTGYGNNDFGDKERNYMIGWKTPNVEADETFYVVANVVDAQNEVIGRTTGFEFTVLNS